MTSGESWSERERAAAREKQRSANPRTYNLLFSVKEASVGPDLANLDADDPLTDEEDEDEDFEEESDDAFYIAALLLQS